MTVESMGDCSKCNCPVNRNSSWDECIVDSKPAYICANCAAYYSDAELLEVGIKLP